MCVCVCVCVYSCVCIRVCVCVCVCVCIYCVCSVLSTVPPQRIDLKQEEVDALKESLQERRKGAEEKVSGQHGDFTSVETSFWVSGTVYSLTVEGLSRQNKTP